MLKIIRKEQAVYEIVKGIDYDLQSYLQETNKNLMQQCGMEKLIIL